MKKLLIALFVLLFVVATLSIYSITERFREKTYSELIEDQARAAAIQRRYEVDTALYEEWAPRLAVLAVLLLAISAGLVIAYLAGLGAAHVRAAWSTTRPDRRGLLPVAREDTEAAVAALIAYHQSRIAEAMRQPVPERLHYAPHIAPRYEPRNPASSETNRVLPGDVQPSLIPSFADFLDKGLVGIGQPLLLGCDVLTGHPVWGDWRDLFSTGLGGMQGSGKTWTAASIAAQSLLHNAQLILCDPHAGDRESLTSRLEPVLSKVSLIAETPDEIVQAVLYAREELELRKVSSLKHRDRRHLIIAVDEWTALVRNMGSELISAISAITTEGRKFNVYALLMSQRWAAEAVGGSDIRNTLTAHYIHRMRVDEARMQTGLRAGALPSDTLTLQPGQAYLCDTRGSIRKVATPYMEQRDLARVALLLNDQNTAQTQQNNATTSLNNVPEVAGEVAGEAGNEVVGNAPLRGHQQAEKWTAEELRIISALKSGKTPGQVAEEIAGSRGGQKYQNAARQVADVIRRALEHIE